MPTQHEESLEILREQDIEECIKKLKIDNENPDLENEFECSICFCFAHNPLNCNDCDFKACQKCYEQYK